jgi:hypothetical protein
MRYDLDSVGVAILPHTAHTKDRRGVRLLRFEFSTDMTDPKARIIPCAIVVEISLPDAVLMWAVTKHIVPLYELKKVSTATWGELFEHGSTSRFFEKMLRKLQVPYGQQPPQCYLKHLEQKFSSSSMLYTLPIEEMDARVLSTIGIDLALPIRIEYKRFLLFFTRTNKTFDGSGKLLMHLRDHDPFFAVSEKDMGRELCEHGYTMRYLMDHGIFSCGHTGNGGYTAFALSDVGD